MKRSDLILRILPEVSGCTDLYISSVLDDVIVDFFTHTGMARQSLSFTTELSVSGYDLSKHTADRILAIDTVLEGDRKLARVELASALAMKAPDALVAYALRSPSRIVLASTSHLQTQTYELQVVYRYAPVLDDMENDGAGDELYSLCYETLVHGVLYRLFRMVGKQWSNINASIMHERIYEDLVTKHKSTSERTFSTSAVRISPYGGL